LNSSLGIKPVFRSDKKTIEHLVIKKLIMYKYIGIDISKQTFDAPMFVKELLYWFLLTDKTRVRIKL